MTARIRAWALVPQKRLAFAKSRIAGRAGPEARASLSLALLEHVCLALRATPAIEEVVIMTPDRGVQHWAGTAGARCVADPSSSFNDALAVVLDAEDRRNAGRWALIVSADLPLLRACDVAAALSAAAGGRETIVAAPSKDGGGTNALILPPGVHVRPAFGPRSRVRHRRLANEHGFRIVEICRPGLAFDLDTPDDLRALSADQRLSSLRVPVTM